MPKKNKITSRLIISFVFLILTFLVFGLYSLYDIRTISGLTRTIYDHPLVVSSTALQSNVAITKMHRDMKDVVLFKSTSQVQQAIAAVEQQEQSVYQYLDIVRDRILGAEGKKLEKETRALFENWRPIRKEVIALVRNGQSEKAAQITIGKGADHVAKLEEKMVALTNYAKSKATIFMNESETTHSRLNISSIIFLILSISVSSLIAIFTLKRTASAENEIRESRQLLVNAIDHAPIGMVLVNLQGKFHRVNQALCEMIGYSENELSVMNFQEITHPDDYDIGSNVVKQLIDGRLDKTSVEKRYVKKDGNIIDVYLTTSLLRNTQGLPSYFFTQVQDVTEYKQAQESLRESTEKLKLIIDTSPLGICTVDPFGNFVTTNSAYEQMLGYSKEELKELSFFDVTHPDYRPKNKELFQNMFFLDSTGFKMEKVYVRKDGGVINVSVNATAVIDDEGNTRFGTAFVDDITEQKQVGEALAESTHLLTEAQRLTSIGSWVQDVPSGRLMWSDETFRIFEIDKDFSGDLFEGFVAAIHPEDRKLTTDAYDNALKTKKPYTVTHRLLMPDGRIKYVIECCETKYDDNGNPVKSTGTVQDITERKEAENEQERLMAQLTQAQKMESVGRLAGGVAHDYNNISSIIIGFSELALDNVEQSDPLHDDLIEILTAARRSTEITRQLLAFARQQTIAPKILDLNDTIGNMLKMLRRLIGEDIDLAWLPGAEVWPIKIDPSQVDQIMANLCVNARDAIADVGKVTVETKNISFDEDYCADHIGFSPGEYVLLAVSDDGSGIAPEILEKVFEPFFTTKGLGKGTGLGLATVYGIVKQNNGFINVYSEQGKGTTIKVYLSRHAGQAVAANREEISEIPLSRGETLLLVEDDGSILKVGKRILEELGYTVLAANTPNEAISLAKEHSGKINLLITDVVMPEMNGRELSKQLQKVYLNLKILFMSGYTANVIAHRGVLDDGVCFIPKPFSKKDMAVKVREVLDGAKG
jgi:two-component system cell cycle sensor histidine kinase/response regulator CckA